jgi:hypothetical protein
VTVATAHLRRKVVTIDRATVETGIQRGLIPEEVRAQARYGWRVESVVKDHRLDAEGYLVDCVRVTFEMPAGPTEGR